MAAAQKMLMLVSRRTSFTVKFSFCLILLPSCLNSTNFQCFLYFIFLNHRTDIDKTKLSKLKVTKLLVFYLKYFRELKVYFVTISN